MTEEEIYREIKGWEEGSEECEGLDWVKLAAKYLYRKLQSEEAKLKDHGDIANVIVPKGTVCPQCSGSGKSGHDRGLPPVPYICDKCNGSGETAL